MRESGRLSAVLGGVPQNIVAGPGPVAIWMHRGLDAASFRCVVKDRACFVKHFAPGLPGAADLAAIAAASGRAAALGIAPDLLLSDEGLGILVFADLTESHAAALRPWFDRPAHLDQVLQGLRRWHAEGLAQRDCDWLVSMQAALTRIEARAGAGQDAALLPSWGALADLAGVVAARLAVAGAPRRPLHGEMLMSNVLRPLSGQGAPLLCDFDRSVMGDPARDLAALWLEVSGRLADIAAFAPDAATAQRLPLWAIAEDLGWGFWAWEAHFQRRDSAVEFFKYARFRLNRARMTGVRAGLLPVPEDLPW